jgi:hypothetical protein
MTSTIRAIQHEIQSGLYPISGNPQDCPTKQHHLGTLHIQGVEYEMSLVFAPIPAKCESKNLNDTQLCSGESPAT